VAGLKLGKRHAGYMECKPPGWIRRLFQGLMVGTLWRCHVCETVWLRDEDQTGHKYWRAIEYRQPWTGS
jgi:hypothetical protein